MFNIFEILSEFFDMSEKVDLFLTPSLNVCTQWIYKDLVPSTSIMYPLPLCSVFRIKYDYKSTKESTHYLSEQVTFTL